MSAGHASPEGALGLLPMAASMVISLIFLIRMRKARAIAYPKHTFLQITVVLAACILVPWFVWKLYEWYCM
jgi:hypothetical protein